MTVTAPATLGNFELEHLLGKGSSAQVYQARRRDDGLRVALKVLTIGTTRVTCPQEREQMRTRFLSEAAITMRLGHPDIVSVYAAGEDNGVFWLAMEMVAGGSLERYSQRSTLLPPRVALGIVARVARALAHAHRQGVVHRDIKPSNVLLDLHAGVLKLSDFGAARLLDSQLTATEVLLGTPVYMAPELLAGDTASAASDLYALGVVLFELLTGRRPHESPSMGELLRQVALEPAPDLRDLCPDLPAALALVLARLLAKGASGRPPGSAAAAAELSEVLSHWPTDPAAGTDAAQY